VRFIGWFASSILLSLAGCDRAPSPASDADVFSVSARDDEQSPRMLFVAEPPAVTYGQAVNLRWQAHPGDECVASGGWQGVRTATGEERSQPLRDDTEFLLSCASGSEAALHKVRVEVRDITPDVEFVTSREQVPASERTTLHWHAEGARICRASGGWEGDLPTSGSFETEPLERSTNFNLTCVSDAGTALASLLVGVLPDRRARS